METTEETKNVVTEMVELLQEYIDPVLPENFTSQLEWKKDFDCRVRCMLRRVSNSKTESTS